MEIIEILIKIAIALTLLNVWILRFNKRTLFRGGTAVSMKDEFQAYGLPSWFMYFIGTLKILSAILLLLSIFYAELETPVLIIIGILMMGAVAMHIKIRDHFFKSIPATILLLLVLMVSLIDV